MVRSDTSSSVSRRQVLRTAGAAIGTVTLGAAGSGMAAAQQSTACDDVDYLYAIVPEAESDVTELLDDAEESQQYCTIEEQLAGILGVQAGDQVRLWDRSLDPSEAGDDSLFTVASVEDDKIGRIRANEADLEAVGIDPLGVGKVTEDVSAECFEETEVLDSGAEQF